MVKTLPRSHSARSAWIETFSIDFREFGIVSRTPQGVRGLKLPGNVVGQLIIRSHSARSAWIETPRRTNMIIEYDVALRKECVD